MALGGQVVDFVGLHLLDDADQAGGVGEVAVVQDKAAVFDMRVFIQMIDTIRIKERAAALDAVDFVTFAEQEFSQVGTVLASNAGNEGFFIHGVELIYG